MAQKVRKKQTPSGLVDHIKLYAEYGYATFPTNDKVCLRGVHWRETKVDKSPSMLKYPYGQFGVKLKADDLIIDLDPRNMGKRKVWTELQTRVSTLGDLAQSATIVKTWSGGFHIYMKKPPEFKTRKSLKEFPGIEFLTEGHYVIGAGSKQEEDGKSGYYTFVNPPDFDSHIFVPDGLLSLLKKNVKDAGVANHPGFSDSADNIQRFKEYLKTCPVAIQGEHGDETTFKTACRGRDYNLTPRKTYEIMLSDWNPRCKPPWSEAGLISKVRNAYTYNEAPPGQRDPNVAFKDNFKQDDKENVEKNFDRYNSGKLKPTLRNAVNLLKRTVGIQGKFSLNEFTENLEIKGLVPWEHQRVNRYREINDREIENIRLYLADKFEGVEFSTQTTWKAVDLVAAGNRHHPVREHILGLKWDGVKRLDTWLPKYCHTIDNELYRMMGRKVITAMIARVFEPGCKFDYVLVLEGRQGIGKSTLCSILGGEWYGDAPIDVKDKDTIPYIHNHWVIELSEMITTRKSESDRLKNFISRTEDDTRLPYARTRIKYPRQCIFIGTINPDDIGYLADYSGNRRFWCVWCDDIDYEDFRGVRDQLIAEAYQVYKNGEVLTMPERLLVEAEENTSERLADDPWYGIISEWSEINPDEDDVRTQDLYRDVLGGSLRTMNTGHQRRIAQALKRCGWVKHNTRSGNRYVRLKMFGAENENS